MKNLGILACALTACTLWAQNDMHANVNLQFRFVNPGARAQAMGGAFIGLADDTTALFANPAGLAKLSSQTLALELGRTRRDNNIPFFGGRIDQVGLQDFNFDLQDRDFPQTTNNIPFFGFVEPRGRLKWGVFAAEQANFERRFVTEGIGIPPPEPQLGIDRFVSSNLFEFFPPSENFIELKLRTLGISLAGKISERLSAGVTVVFNDFDYRGNTTLQIPNIEALFPEVNFSPSALEALRPFYGVPFTIIDVEGDDQALGYYGGLLFSPTDRFSLGLAYKRQPRHDYRWQTDGLDGNFQALPTETGVGQFDVPDSAGIGFSFLASDTFLISMEVNRLFYSDLVDDFVVFFANDQDPSGITQTVGDTTEYHVGMEYFFVNGKYPIAVRAGYWFEPYHALQNTSLDTQILFRFLNQFGDFVQGSRQTVFLRRFEQDQNHLTFGAGLTFGSFTVDFAGDISEQNQAFSLSSIYRF